MPVTPAVPLEWNSRITRPVATALVSGVVGLMAVMMKPFWLVPESAVLTAVFSFAPEGRPAESANRSRVWPSSINHSASLHVDAEMAMSQ